MGLELKITTELPGFTLDVSWSIQSELVVLFGHSGGRVIQPGLPSTVLNDPVNEKVISTVDLRKLYSGYIFA